MRDGWELAVTEASERCIFPGYTWTKDPWLQRPPGCWRSAPNPQLNRPGAGPSQLLQLPEANTENEVGLTVMVGYIALD